MTEFIFTTKDQAIAGLDSEFRRWDSLLSVLSDQEAERILYPARTIKDDVAHLYEWQRLSLARIDAVLEHKPPDVSYWPDWFDPLSEEDADVERINTWIYDQHKTASWKSVYMLWKEGFLQVLHRAALISDDDYLVRGTWSWLGKYRMLDVLIGSYQHYHDDHLPLLQAAS